jgi:hypothetical protein
MRLLVSLVIIGLAAHALPREPLRQPLQAQIPAQGLTLVLRPNIPRRRSSETIVLYKIIEHGSEGGEP